LTLSTGRSSERINDRHIKMAHEVMAKLAERIEALQTTEVTVGNLGRLFELCVKVERLALGESTENVHAAHEGVENGAPIRHAVLGKVIVLPPNGRDPVPEAFRSGFPSNTQFDRTTWFAPAIRQRQNLLSPTSSTMSYYSKA
jgi:hypothetical protein